MQRMRYRTLGRTSLELSELGYGCAGLAGAYRTVTDGEGAAVLSTAWDAGIRYFDTAPAYGLGRAERMVGDFLRTKHAGEYVLSTKVGKLLRPSTAIAAPNMPFDLAFDYSYDGIMRSFEFSQARLGLARIHMLFVDDLEPSTLGLLDYRRHLHAFLNSGVRALEQLRSNGDIAAYGLGVNDVGACIDIMHRISLDCLLLNGRYTLLDRTAGTRVTGMCERSQTPMIVGSLFNGGMLATGVARDGTDDIQARAEHARAIAQAAGVSLDAAAVQFPLRSKFVASALVGTTRPERIAAAVSGMQATIPELTWGGFTSIALN
jgi:D-threo-aldose 1-dehydrogenase